MSYKMACEHSDRIAVIVSQAGMMPLDRTLCQPTHPVSILHVHGTNNSTIHYNEGNIFGVVYPSAELSMGDWIANNGCSTGLQQNGALMDLVTTVDGPETTPYTASCPNGVDVSHWKMQDAPHTPTL